MKQDRNGVRTAQDLERKYNLADLISVKKAVELQEEGINKTNTTLEKFMVSTLGSIDDLQQQIDGSITTYYCSGVPTLDNYPANEWTEEEYTTHIGNMYYDKDTGYAYRFFLDGDTYRWVKIADSDVEEALRQASLAQDTADGKRRVFTTTPFVPYDEGDLWLYDKELYVCVTPKTKNEIYNVNDFAKATKYTDDSALNVFITGEYADEINTINKQIDSKAETWYQSTDPSIQWTTTELKAAHIGDLWYNTTENKNYVYTSSYTWAEIDGVPDNVYDAIDGKAQIFTSQPIPPYYEGDLYVQGDNGDILVCTTKRLSGSYVASEWKKASKYTDDSKLNAFISGEYADDIDAINTQLDKKAETWYQNTDPSSNWTTAETKLNHVGDLWYNTTTNKNYIYTSSYTWQEIDGVPKSVYDEIDGKAQIFTSQPKPPYYVGDLYTQGSTGDILVCKTERLTGNYTASDWVRASKYTDDTNLNNFVNNVYPEDLADLTNQIDAKVTTWYYSGEPTLGNAPANTWLEVDYIKHTGDLYYDKETGHAYTFQATEGIYGWVQLVDTDLIEALSIANAAQDTADNKRRIFLDTPEPPYDNGDLWLNNEEIYVCQIGKPEGELYAEGDFIVGVKYTDDTVANEVANELTIVKGQVTTIIEDNNEIKVTFTETTNLVNDLTNEVADEIATRSAMIRATSEDGKPVIELGSTESPVQTKYKNDGMYIEENGATTSYFKNGKAYNYDMEVLHALTIGRFAFKPRKNGNLSLVYTGGDE